MIIRKIDLKRAEDILTTLNPKFKWYYSYNTSEFIFFSENKNFVYKVRLVNIGNEAKINVISHFLSLLNEVNSQKIDKN